MLPPKPLWVNYQASSGWGDIALPLCGGVPQHYTATKTLELQLFNALFENEQLRKGKVVAHKVAKETKKPPSFAAQYQKAQQAAGLTATTPWASQAMVGGIPNAVLVAVGAGLLLWWVTR